MSLSQTDNRQTENRDSFKPRNSERREHREKESHAGSHVRILVGQGEPIEKAIRKFKKLCEKAGIKKELKARRYYEKPSEARRREARKRERDAHKREKKVFEQKKYQKNKPVKHEEF